MLISLVTASKNCSACNGGYSNFLVTKIKRAQTKLQARFCWKSLDLFCVSDIQRNMLVTVIWFRFNLDRSQSQSSNVSQIFGSLFYIVITIKNCWKSQLGMFFYYDTLICKTWDWADMTWDSARSCSGAGCVGALTEENPLQCGSLAYVHKTLQRSEQSNQSLKWLWIKALF